MIRARVPRVEVTHDAHVARACLSGELGCGGLRNSTIVEFPAVPEPANHRARQSRRARVPRVEVAPEAVSACACPLGELAHGGLRSGTIVPLPAAPEPANHRARQSSRARIPRVEVARDAVVACPCPPSELDRGCLPNFWTIVQKFPAALPEPANHRARPSLKGWGVTLAPVAPPSADIGASIRYGLSHFEDRPANLARGGLRSAPIDAFPAVPERRDHRGPFTQPDNPRRPHAQLPARSRTATAPERRRPASRTRHERRRQEQAATRSARAAS